MINEALVTIIVINEVAARSTDNNTKGRHSYILTIGNDEYNIGRKTMYQVGGAAVFFQLRTNQKIKWLELLGTNVVLM